MATTFRLVIENDDPNGINGTFSTAVADGDGPRMLAYLMQGTPHGKVTETVDGVSVTRNATPMECLASYANGSFEGLKANAERWWREQAAAQAAAGVPPIQVIDPA